MGSQGVRLFTQVAQQRAEVQKDAGGVVDTGQRSAPLSASDAGHQRASELFHCHLGSQLQVDIAEGLTSHQPSSLRPPRHAWQRSVEVAGPQPCRMQAAPSPVRNRWMPGTQRPANNTTATASLHPPTRAEMLETPTRSGRKRHAGSCPKAGLATSAASRRPVPRRASP